MRWTALALVFGALACATSTSVTRTGTGLFAPRENSDEGDVPRGLSLSIESVAPDGTVLLDLRNYSAETFVFAGTLDRPQLIFEVSAGATQSRHTLSPWVGKQVHEVPPGERVRLKTSVAGASGRVRIGIRSREFGFTVWTDWIPR